MQPRNIIINLCSVLLVVGCEGSSGSGGSSNTDTNAPDAGEVASEDAQAPDATEDVDIGPDPGSVQSAPSCLAYCQGLMDKLFAPGGTQASDLECLQQNVGTPPAFDLNCLMGAATPSYEGCLECYTGEESGEVTCAALVAACL